MGILCVALKMNCDVSRQLSNESIQITMFSVGKAGKGVNEMKAKKMLGLWTILALMATMFACSENVKGTGVTVTTNNTASIEGYVLQQDSVLRKVALGDPNGVGGALVRLYYQDRIVTTDTSDESGFFKFDSLTAGLYSIIVKLSNGTSVEVDSVSVDANENVLQNVQVYHYVGISGISSTETSSSTLGSSSDAGISSSSAIQWNTESCKFASITTTSGTLVCPNHTYTTIRIGVQIWLRQNLAWLPLVGDTSGQSLTDARYHVYGYNGTSIDSAKMDANYSTYGVLYNHTAALTACPAGWRLPTDIDWMTLESTIGVTTGDLAIDGWRGTVEGNALRSNSALWITAVNLATNSTDFSALPAGMMRDSNGFSEMGNNTYFWTSTKDQTTKLPILRHLNSDNPRIDRYQDSITNGYSVRCLQN